VEAAGPIVFSVVGQSNATIRMIFIAFNMMLYVMFC
jgi:hypothetical protein